jgi:hypothetical protein
MKPIVAALGGAAAVAGCAPAQKETSKNASEAGNSKRIEAPKERQ